MDLLGEDSEIFHIILLLELCLVHRYQVLLLLLPVELLALEPARVLDLLALVLETRVSKIVYLLDVVNILLTLMLCVIIYFEWALRSHEVWVCLGVIIGRYLLSI